MKSYTTIIDVIESRCNDISYETVAQQFGIGFGTVYRIERILRD